MSAGTLTLTNNSAAVAGSGTAFTTELAAGDFIVVTVGGVPYTLPVKTVNSNTSATLVSNFTGPTQSGAAWYAVPRIAMNLVTAAAVTQAAEALRGLNYDKQNWQSIFSGTGTATVRLPDGSSFTGPAWGGISTTLDGISTTLDGKAGKGANRDITSLSGLTTPLDLKQGGTGATDAAGARTALGLGSGDAPQFSGLNIRNSGDIISEMYNSNVSASVIGTKTQWHYNASENPSAVMLVRRNASNTIGQIVVTMPNTAGVVQLTGTSGRDYKEAIAPADSAEAMARVMGLDLVTFIYKDDALRRVRFGIIAEEAEKVAPQYIKHFKFPIEGTETYDDEGNQINVEYRDRPVVDTNPIVMDLLGTVQYQQKMIKDMAESIEILESRLT